MPAKSEAQRRWAFGVMGEDWAREHHFDTPGKLPKRKRRKKSKANRRKAARALMDGKD